MKFSRNPEPFTERRQRFVAALSETLKAINDPDSPDVSDHYEYRSELLKGFGEIPKIRFYPHGKDTYYKAEIMRKTGLVNQETTQKIVALREKVGFKKARDEEHRVLARQFESEWNNLMHQLVKATRALSAINYALSELGSGMAEPIRIIQGIVVGELSNLVHDK